MKFKLNEDAGSITTRAELVQRLQLLWRDITTEKNQELYSSLPSRMAAVIKCKSTITKYNFKEDIFIFLSMQLSSYFDFYVIFYLTICIVSRWFKCIKIKNELARNHETNPN